MTLRCTKKLLKRVPSSSTSSGVRPTNALGDWYADILFTEPAWVVICVSERSLVSVLIPARGLSSLVPRFRVAVGELLLRLGVSNEQVRAERQEMVEIVIGPTASRSVLGSMNDLMFQCRGRLAQSGVRDLESIALELADVPCGPLGYKHPGQVAVELLRAVSTRAFVRPSQNPKSRLESKGA